MTRRETVHTSSHGDILLNLKTWKVFLLSNTIQSRAAADHLADSEPHRSISHKFISQPHPLTGQLLPGSDSLGCSLINTGALILISRVHVVNSPSKIINYVHLMYMYHFPHKKIPNSYSRCGVLCGVVPVCFCWSGRLPLGPPVSPPISLLGF